MLELVHPSAVDTNLSALNTGGGYRLMMIQMFLVNNEMKIFNLELLLATSSINTDLPVTTSYPRHILNLVLLNGQLLKRVLAQKQMSQREIKTLSFGGASTVTFTDTHSRGVELQHLFTHTNAASYRGKQAWNLMKYWSMFPPFNHIQDI